MNDTDRPENERVAYCQNCGRPLSADAARNVGASVFCEPCLVAKVAAAESAGASGPGGKAGGSYGFSGRSSGVNYKFQGTTGDFQGTTGPSAPPLAGEPNPGLAVLLGFIPGVGAFYNGQYAKGVVHLVVFAVLVTLTEQNGIFGMFVAGWIFYQVIEAHHTARARRDGTPLPNPFGLNDIGERLGFGRAWPASAPSPGQAGAGWGSGPGAGQRAAPMGAASDPSAGGASMPPASAAPPPPNYASYGPPAPGWGATQETYSGVVPPPPTDFSVSSANDSANRVPVGAILLIALGVVFLLGNSGMFRGFPVHRLIPFLIIGVGVWLFVHKMMETGGGWTDDGTPAYRLRLFRAARGAVWIVLVGVLSVLDSFGILSWGRSWPLFIIVAGVMAFAQRTAYSAVPPLPYNYVPPVAAPPPGPTAASPSAAVPTSSIESAEERERS